MTAALLILMSLALCVAARWLSGRVGIVGVVAVAVMCMTRLPLMADIQVDIFGLRSNFGNLLFAPVLFCSALAASRFGRAVAHTGFIALFVAASCSVGILMSATELSLPDGGVLANFRHIVPAAGRVAAASFMAFIFSNEICILIAARNRPVLAQIVGQLADSIIFFPMAFWNVPDFDLITAAFGGLAIKCGIALLTWPLFCGVKRSDQKP